VATEPIAFPIPLPARAVLTPPRHGAGNRAGPTLVLDEANLAAPTYRQFLEALGVAVYTTDSDGRITFYNPAAAELWGRSPELGELWCGSWKLFWPTGEPMPHGDCPMAIALKTGESVRGYEGVAERPDGRRISFIPYPTVVKDASGQMIGAINVLIDVTDRRAAEDELRMALAVKDEFLGLVSHELRTPVTTIYGNARLLSGRSDLPAPLGEMVGDLAGEAERLLSLVENLLVLTRSGSGRADLEPHVLCRLVRNAVAAFQRRHPARRIEVHGAFEGAIANADQGVVELVIDNLLGNADKYSPADSVIDVVLEEGPTDLVVRILDRGIGFDESESEAMFTAFYRSEAARKMSSGLGIGLSACRRLVELLGGQIWARPRDGGGSELGFAVPRAALAED
jgi:PAS domain S-box-containing protein